MDEKLRLIRYKKLIQLISELDDDPDMPPGLKNALNAQLNNLNQARDAKAQR